MQAEIDSLAESYAHTEVEIRSSELSLADAELAEQQALGALEIARDNLATRLVHYYKQNETASPALVQVLLGSTSLTAAISVLPHLAAVAEEDKSLVDRVSSLAEGLLALQAETARRRRSLDDRLIVLEAIRIDLSQKLDDAAVEHARLGQEVAVLEHADELLRSSEAARERWRGRVGARFLERASGFVFPIDGPHWFTHDWGFPRPDDRVHKGTDIMAPRGTPVVATRAGWVHEVAYHRPLGGTVVWLAGEDGTLYYYAHLATVNPELATGLRVVAGLPLGTVGTSGNANGGDPHLHFGMYPGHGEAVDPYLLLLVSD
ncbi:MAG: murein hydrolase activator EnvC family protein [Thermoleophilia bacterium]